MSRGDLRWRIPDRGQFGAGQNLDARILDLVRGEMSSAGVRQWLTPGTIPLSTVERAGFTISHTEGANYSITATSFTEVDGADLAGTLRASGADVRVDFAAIVIPGTTNIRLSVSANGTEVTGATFGLGMTTTTTTLAGFWVIEHPDPGPLRIALLASVDAGTGTISAGADSRVLLAAREV